MNINLEHLDDESCFSLVEGGDVWRLDPGRETASLVCRHEDTTETQIKVKGKQSVIMVTEDEVSMHVFDDGFVKADEDTE